ncbi:MAG: SCO family protein [Hyphomicrobiaceae bacterium]|nr:SCO family protein [Hyphomicrobiaceae bacterium]
MKLSRALALAIMIGLPSAMVASGSAADVSVFPRPGTYKLPRIFPAPDSWVLEKSRWWPHSLSSYTSGKITLLGFFYATCRDPEGCPATWSLYETIHELVGKKAELHNKVRLVLISLDPRLDTPDRLEIFSIARSDTHHIAPWHFLTTWSDRYLGSILDGFGQAAARDLDENNNPAPTISHQVKFYLLDRSSWVREIYSPAFVTPEVIENDIRTLLIEANELPATVPMQPRGARYENPN